jgi:cyclic pyranopterin phosphate synthase
MDKLSFLCNVSPQAKDTDEQRNQVHYMLKTFNQRVQIGVTLTGPSLEYQYLIDYIEKYDLIRRIRIGIAQPIVGPTRNSHLPTKLYRETGKFIVSMAKQCVKKDILLGFDCGLTLCMFDEEEIGILTKSADGYRGLCDPIIDVGPELDIWHCFPLAETLNANLEQFQTRKEILHYYKKITAPYKQLGCMNKCINCIYKKRQQCTGGCLAHAMNSLNKYPPRIAPPPPVDIQG